MIMKSFPKFFFWSQKYTRPIHHRKNEVFLKILRLFLSIQSHQIIEANCLEAKTDSFHPKPHYMLMTKSGGLIFCKQTIE